MTEVFDYKRVYGLTGSISCGKTTVASIFKKFSIPVLDLDFVSRKVVKQGSQGYKQIIEVFGELYLDSYGNLDRKRLGELIFKDKEAKKKLESILHPLIFEYEKKFIYNYRKVFPDRPIIVDAALMIETGSFKRYSKIILVYIPENIQIERLMKRDSISYADAEIRVKNQISIEEKRKFANYIIDNSKNLDYTEAQVKKIAEEL